MDLTPPQYVMGFMFSNEFERVILIKKTHPDRFSGTFNGVGGHCEPYEAPEKAIIRETREETGLEILGWKLAVELSWKTGSTLFVFGVVLPNEAFNKYSSPTNESVGEFQVSHLQATAKSGVLPLPYNLLWLLHVTLARLQGGPLLKGQEIENG